MTRGFFFMEKSCQNCYYYFPGSHFEPPYCANDEEYRTEDSEFFKEWRLYFEDAEETR